MKQIISILILITFSLNVTAQVDLELESNNILTEGIMLYKLEKAAWQSTDTLKTLIEATDITGYVALFNNDKINVLYYKALSDTSYNILHTIEFDTTFNVNFLNVNNNIRKPNQLELEYINLREGAYGILSHFDGMYGTYRNTNKNIIILRVNDNFTIFSTTGTTETGIIPLGNDFEFSSNLHEKNMDYVGKIHSNYIPLSVNNLPENVAATMHNHSWQSSKFITSTDICILLLYRDFIPVKKHIVFSRRYVSIFDIENCQLEIMTKKDYNKLSD